MIKGPEDKVVQAYFEYMVDFAEILGADRKRAAKELHSSLQFEIDIAAVSI